MKRIENECVICSLPCIGSVCPNRNVSRFYCDRCGREEKLYYYYSEEICEECLLEEFMVVEGSDYQ